MTKKGLRITCMAGMLPVLLVVLSSFFGHRDKSARRASFPWKQAGLTKEQAAAHLLSRFTYGATPGEVQAVVKEGLEHWFKAQLEAQQPDDSLQKMLAEYDALQLTNEQVTNLFPRNFQVVRMAVKDSVINKDSVGSDRPYYRDKLKEYMAQKGLRPEQDLMRQFVCQKIVRATYTQNQLQEVMTSFWFNHFNVSYTKNDCSQFIPAYERDIIRPNALGNFETMLVATAKSPAMLTFLDNFSSTGTRMVPDGKGVKKKQGGLNENYAREVMELHTMGVDGGYTQSDVTQAARILTGWGIYPMGNYAVEAREKLERAGDDKLAKRGFVHEGDFLFTPNRHDDSAKTVLGKSFNTPEGYTEGVELLHLLAHHPSTAAFISRKLATRFVSDNPPQSLIDKMAKTFLDKGGDIKEVLLTMVSAPEFWSKDAVREKTKSPFELAISSVRSLNAAVTKPYELYNWMNRMGEKVYYYQAPTGFPDKGQYWINTGSLLNRMNFGLALASGRIPGVTFNLLALNNNHEPESAEAALATFSKLLMPERDNTATIKRLTPLLNDPELQHKIDKAAGKNSNNMMMHAQTDSSGETTPRSYAVQKTTPAGNNMTDNKYLLSQVAGIIIGSPEFQRR